MSPNLTKLRPPYDLETVFYKELLAPLRAFAASRLNDESRVEVFRLLTQRFRKDILRYGYVVTEVGVMVQLEPDILDTKIDAAHLAMMKLDMQILNRLSHRP
jgi:hypothetical protein